VLLTREGDGHTSSSLGPRSRTNAATRTTSHTRDAEHRVRKLSAERYRNGQRRKREVDASDCRPAYEAFA
jgi:hypothetical protein